MDNKSSTVVKASVGYTVSNILVKGISFITLPLFVRMMSVEDYGVYTTYVSYESILAIVIGLGLHASIRAANNEFKESINAYCSSVVLLPVINSLCFLLMAVVLGNLVPLFPNHNKLIVIAMVLQSFGTSVLYIYNTILSLKYKYKEYLMVSVFNTIGNIAISLILIIYCFRTETYFARMVGSVIPLILVSIYIFFRLNKKSRIEYSKQYSLFALKYSTPLIPHGLSQVVLAQFGKIVIQSVYGYAIAGIYGFAYTIVLIPQVLSASLETVFSTWFFENYKNNTRNKVRRFSSMYVFAYSLVIIAMIAVSPEVIYIMGGEAYGKANEILIPALIGVLITHLYTVPVQVEYYEKRTNYIAIGTLFAAVLDVILCITLIPKYGYKIAVYITVATYSLYYIYHTIIAYRLSKDNYPVDIRKTLVMFVSIVLCAVVSYFSVNQILVRCISVIVTTVVLFVINASDISGYLALSNS